MEAIVIPKNAAYFNIDHNSFIDHNGCTIAEKKISDYVKWNHDTELISTNGKQMNFSQYTKKGKLLKTSLKTGTILKKMKSSETYRLSPILKILTI